MMNSSSWPRSIRPKGLRSVTARQVAVELTANDPLLAHADAELHVDPNNLTNPFHAAGASAVSFLFGALLPLIAILLPPPAARVPVTVAAVLMALAVAGMVSARIGGSSIRLAVTRVVVGGAAGLALTYGIGHLFGTAVTSPAPPTKSILIVNAQMKNSVLSTGLAGSGLGTDFVRAVKQSWYSGRLRRVMFR
jgi:hypothetical protein